MKEEQRKADEERAEKNQQVSTDIIWIYQVLKVKDETQLAGINTANSYLDSYKLLQMGTKSPTTIILYIIITVTYLIYIYIDKVTYKSQLCFVLRENNVLWVVTSYFCISGTMSSLVFSATGWRYCCLCPWSWTSKTAWGRSHGTDGRSPTESQGRKGQEKKSRLRKKETGDHEVGCLFYNAFVLLKYKIISKSQYLTLDFQNCCVFDNFKHQMKV